MRAIILLSHYFIWLFSFFNPLSGAGHQKEMIAHQKPSCEKL